MARKRTDTRKHTNRSDLPGHRCGLCGRAENLIQTECCGQWICNDESKYVAFSYARNSCSRNHSRFTLCGFHHAEGHSGNWQDCPGCRGEFETEIYVYYGTNEYNFTRLENPPSYSPTKCGKCGTVIRLGSGGYSFHKGRYFCGKCSGV